jgi:hypothetical protein
MLNWSSLGPYLPIGRPDHEDVLIPKRPLGGTLAGPADADLALGKRSLSDVQVGIGVTQQDW